MNGLMGFIAVDNGHSSSSSTLIIIIMINASIYKVHTVNNRS